MNARRGLLVAAAVLLSSVVNAQPFAFAVNSDDELNADSLLRVNLANGDVEFIGALPAFLEDVEGLAFDAEGRLFAVDNASKSLAMIDSQTGDANAVNARQSNLGFLSTQALDFGMTFSCTGNLYLVAEQTQSLYEVDTGSGQALVVGSSGGLGDSMTAIASYGSKLYALAANSSNLYRVNPDAGTSEFLMTLAEHTITDAGMAFDENGILWAILDGSGRDANGNAMFEPSTILRINISSGEVREMARTRTGIESLAIGGPGSCDVLGTPGLMPVPTLSQWGVLFMIALLMPFAYRRLALKR
jgi:DNA-binding beta-propeller fold protein YncE